MHVRLGLMGVVALLVACESSSDPAPSSAGSGGTAGSGGAGGSMGGYTLTVVNGYGSGQYAPGEIVHVWSAVRPWTETVMEWSGDADLLALPDEWHTTLTMPDRDAQVEAIIDERSEQLAEATYQGTTQYDKTVLSFIPASPKALLFLLHGTGGSARMIEKPEALYLAMTAIARGYGVLSTEAEEVAAGDANGDGKIRWNPKLSSDNVDFANLDSLIASLLQQGTIDASVPLFVVGMSNGGAMSVSLGAVAASPVADDFPNLQFGAAVSFCASGRASAAAVSTTPTAWLLCANDDNDQVSNDDAQQNSAALAERGVPTFVDAHPASPLYDERFTRVPNVDAATSTAIAAELRAGGFVGHDELFTTPTKQMIELIQADGSSYPTTAALPAKTASLVVNQIRVMQAEHQMYSDWASRALDFVEEPQAGK